ncbi:hypothetical protein S2091_0926 [Solimicrobium silvestre]|uniref:Uncharacterized protein n=1 Tax=Solimicrobium silvestre TaxID=2099400 RepID=A0A2S9H2U2_9BURK|nr:hypothetical protein S2091_0926 [Solimicrobium silvestre]
MSGEERRIQRVAARWIITAITAMSAHCRQIGLLKPVIQAARFEYKRKVSYPIETPGWHKCRMKNVVEILPNASTVNMPLWLVVHRKIKGNPIIGNVFNQLSKILIEEISVDQRHFCQLYFNYIHRPPFFLPL